MDLGRQPLANAYVPPERLAEPDPVFPLHVKVCEECLLVQVQETVPASEIFEHYAYFSSYSDTWVAHARRFARDAIRELGLDEAAEVIEVGSNDGYLLRHFVERGIPVLGVDPARNVAEEARRAGVPTDCSFFGEGTARRLRDDGHAADLIVANNVLAHVPRPRDLVRGLRLLLKPEGVVSVEVPHLLELIRRCEFDTIYHEHYSYFSLLVLEALFRGQGLRVFRVDQLSTHGGSLRIWACHVDAERPTDGSVADLLSAERREGLGTMETYERFADRVVGVRDALLDLLEEARGEGMTTAAYGAAAKGNTLLNYCGIDRRLVRFVVDRNPHKQGNYLPGSRLPILPPEQLRESRPDYVLVLPWNLRDEILDAVSFIHEWGGRFIIPIPSPTVLE